MIRGSRKLLQFIETMDPFGTSVNSLQLGYAITAGAFFPMLDGAIFLARRELYPAPQGWIMCGLAGADASSIKNFPGFTHLAEMGYQYIAARSDGNGYVSQWSAPTRVDFDDEGALITPRLPAWPVDLRAEAIAGGKFRVHWRYDTWGQGAEPSTFGIHIGLTVATIAYGYIIGSTAYVPGQQSYYFDTSAFGDGLQRAFAVRARNSGAVAEQNELATELVTARAAAPAAAVIDTINQVGRIYGQ